MNALNYSELKEPILQILEKAGSEIMKIYLNPELSNTITIKEDESPLTIADSMSNQVVVSSLKSEFDFPILSEESKLANYEERKNWERFWLVDPLDGTKEFINKNGEFTVNIALIENRQPVFGAICVPAKNIFYVGYNDEAIKIENSIEKRIRVNHKENKRIAVRSKSHPSPEEEEILKQFNVENFISVGSSLKFCMVAEGKADVYYRHGPTMEWDIAAGHAIVKAAGGEIYSGNKKGTVFHFNKENLLNGSFLCLGF